MKDNESKQILSVYLSGSGKQTPYLDDLLTQFHELIHQALTEDERNRWSKDIGKIEKYLHESFERSNVRSVVFFASGKKNWQVLQFEFVLPPLVKILPESYLEPLKNKADQYQKYLVLLVDREKARLFTVHLGKIEEHKDIINGEVPQNVKAKKIDYGRDDIIFRHIQQHLHRHLQNIAGKTRDFTKGKNIHFIILGGHIEMIPRIKKHLPYPLNKMVLGEFITELNIPLNEVLLHSKKVATRINNLQR